MSNVNVGKAFSTGIGLALGLTMANYTFTALKPPEKTRRIVCQDCGNRNPEENKFCYECGRPLYPPPRTFCPKCDATVIAAKFCGVCGALLQRQRKRRRK
jgi:rRNA maturation endonuclease Nob1